MYQFVSLTRLRFLQARRQGLVCFCISVLNKQHRLGDSRNVPFTVKLKQGGNIYMIKADTAVFCFNLLGFFFLHKNEASYYI